MHVKPTPTVWIGALAAPSLALLSYSSGGELGWPIAALWLGLLCYNVSLHWTAQRQPEAVLQPERPAATPLAPSPSPATAAAPPPAPAAASPARPGTPNVAQMMSLRQSPLTVECSPGIFKVLETATTQKISGAIVAGFQQKFGIKLEGVKFESNPKLEGGHYRILIWAGLAGQGKYVMGQVCTVDPNRLDEVPQVVSWRPREERQQAVKDGLLVLDLPTLLAMQLMEIASTYPWELWKIYHTIERLEEIKKANPKLYNAAVHRLKPSQIHHVLLELLRQDQNIGDLVNIITLLLQHPVEQLTPEELATRVKPDLGKPVPPRPQAVVAPHEPDHALKAAWLFTVLWHPYFREQICRKLNPDQERRLSLAVLRLSGLSDQTVASLRQWWHDEMDGTQDVSETYTERIISLLEERDGASEWNRPNDLRVALILSTIPPELASPVLDVMLASLTQGPRRDLVVALGSTLRQGVHPGGAAREREVTGFLLRAARRISREAPAPCVAPIERLVQQHVQLVAAWIQSEWLASRSGLEQLRRLATDNPTLLAELLLRELTLGTDEHLLTGPDKTAVLLEGLPEPLREDLLRHLVVPSLPTVEATELQRLEVRQELLEGWTATHPSLSVSRQ